MTLSTVASVRNWATTAHAAEKAEGGVAPLQTPPSVDQPVPRPRPALLVLSCLRIRQVRLGASRSLDGGRRAGRERR